MTGGNNTNGKDSSIQQKSPLTFFFSGIFHKTKQNKKIKRLIFYWILRSRLMSHRPSDGIHVMMHALQVFKSVLLFLLLQVALSIFNISTERSRAVSSPHLRPRRATWRLERPHGDSCSSADEIISVALHVLLLLFLLRLSDRPHWEPAVSPQYSTVNF